VGFDPETFEVSFHDITGWYEGPSDRIFEVVLASGRTVRVTVGHNLFTVDGDGQLRKVRTAALAPGSSVAIPRRMPRPSVSQVAARTERAGAAIHEDSGTGVQVLARPDSRIDGDLAWDSVVEVRDTGVSEPIFDLEVRPGGRKIENFLAGHGGIFVSNTAGFVDAGWDGHLTLELSNVATLPIAIYPGMKIGQISFLQMTTPARNPYGSEATGSKYQGQRGPTPSRYYLNFERDDR
jgi:hypothetical protein